jgi:hypothetical protein
MWVFRTVLSHISFPAEGEKLYFCYKGDTEDVYPVSVALAMYGHLNLN